MKQRKISCRLVWSVGSFNPSVTVIPVLINEHPKVHSTAFPCAFLNPSQDWLRNSADCSLFVLPEPILCPLPCSVPSSGGLGQREAPAGDGMMRERRQDVYSPFSLSVVPAVAASQVAPLLQLQPNLLSDSAQDEK